MPYKKPLPREATLVRLAAQVSFPATRDELITAARRRAFSPTMISFLKLYSFADTFESRLDFLNQSIELEMLIREDRSAIAEFLRSPEG